MSPSDAGLAARFRDANDRTAFENLVRRHLAPLRRYLAVASGGDPRIQELAEREVLIRLYARLASWRAEGPFSTVLFAVARHVVARTLRRVRPSAKPVSNDAAERLVQRLGQLTEPERSLLYLHEAEGCPLPQLSVIFSLKEDVLVSLLDKAKAHFDALGREERYA